ncbi:MAG: LysM peptidoglycan-binding domain-containing protein, partial [Anaerolineales bacterium]
LRGTILRETISLAPESFAVSPDGRYAAYTNLDHTALVLRDLANPEVQEEVLTASVPLSSLLAFSADAGWLASVEPSGNVLVWDVGARSLSFRLQHPKPVRALAFSPASSRRLAVGAGDGVWLWERGDGTFVGIDDPLGELPVEALAFSPDGERLAAADSEHAITIWQVSNGEALLRFPAHDATITRLAFSPNGRRLASASRDKTVKIFAFSETSGGTLRGTLVHTLQHIDTVVGAAFSPEGRALGTTMGWGQPQLWNPDTGLASEIPAGLPFDSETASIAFVQMDGAPHLITVSTEGTLDWYTLADVSDRVTAVPEPFFFTRAEGDFIQRKVNIQTSPPGQSLEKAYSLTLEDAAALAGFEVKIPDFGFSNRYEPIGAAYDAVAQTVAFAYHYNAPAGDTPVQVYLIQWPQSAPQPDIGGSWSVLPSKQLIGASAIVQRVQIGRGVGEFVAGSWIPLAQDNPELLAFPWDEILEGEYTLWHRWNPAYFHRLRWQQGDTMLEIQTGFVNPPGKAHVFGVEEMQQIAMDIAKQDEAPTLLAYTIQDGDTCISIAFKYGITTRAIMHTNGLDNCDLIIAGQTLLIPLPQARNFIISTDLNCDGASEGIQIIPAPQAYGDSFTNFGAVMKTYLRTSADTAVFWPVWQLTIADIPVEFFGVPEVFSMGGCEELLAITAFGGDPAFAGLDVYRWDGEQMTLVLDANGFVEGPIRDLPQAGGAPFTISTQNLAYDETTAVCTRTTTTYEWDRETFVEAGVDVKEGADCFASAP